MLRHLRGVGFGPAPLIRAAVDAWRMVVPKELGRAYDLAHPDGPG